MIVDFLHWRMVFFVNLPIGLVGLYMVYRHLPDYRAERSEKLDVTGLVLFGSGIALLSYVLEIFGEHTLTAREVVGLLALSLVLARGVRAARRDHGASAAAAGAVPASGRCAARSCGSFVTRLGVGGMPFLLPLLYQVGLGYTPVQSGLLIMPQSVAAMGLKMTMPMILTRFGYRRVLLANTLCLGAIIALFATIGAGTPVWLIVAQAFAFGFLSSLQFTSMNTLVYADVTPAETSMASTIASTVQQMSMSFGVAAASLTAAFFVPDRFHTDAPQMIHGVHQAFLALGALTALSAAVFAQLRAKDGESVSQHQVAEAR